MLKTFQYRLYPTKAQETRMRAALEECRWLYNHFLAARKDAWEEGRESLCLYDQLGTVPSLKAERSSLAIVHSQVLQNVAVRVDLAFKGFFRRVKAGEKPGYPRFRGRNRYDSFCYPQAPSGCKLSGDRLTLSGIGTVRVRLHRPLEGQPKTVTVRRSSTGKWYATFACRWGPTPLPASPERVGIDVGLHSFAAFSTGERPLENLRFLRQEEKALAKAQRRLARESSGTPERQKRRNVVARVHERTRWKRQDFAHQHSRRIVNRFQVIAVEDLPVSRMVHNHCLAKSIIDAAWAAFATMLSYKAGYPLAGGRRACPGKLPPQGGGAVTLPYGRHNGTGISCIDAVLKPVRHVNCTPQALQQNRTTPASLPIAAGYNGALVFTGVRVGQRGREGVYRAPGSNRQAARPLDR